MTQRSDSALPTLPDAHDSDHVAWFEQLTRSDVPQVGGKGANLGELTRAGMPVPPGFVITAQAYLQAMEGPACAARCSRRPVRSTWTPPRRWPARPRGSRSWCGPPACPTGCSGRS